MRASGETAHPRPVARRGRPRRRDEAAGNLPTGAAHARAATEALTRELRAFLAGDDHGPADRGGAQTALDVLDYCAAGRLEVRGAQRPRP